MPAGYDPYQQNFQAGGALGDIGGNIIKILAMFGMGGKGPLKFLQGIMGGGTEEQSVGETAIPTGRGQGDAMGAGKMAPELMNMLPPQGPPPGGPPPGGPQMGTPMGPMPGGPPGMPPMGPQGGPQMGGGPQGPQQDQIMKMIMALLQQQGGPPMGGMMG